MPPTLMMVNLDALAAYKEITTQEVVIAAALSGTAAMLAAALVNTLWPRTRMWRIGSPLLGALIAAPLSYLLLLMGAGQVGTDAATGRIIWPPVAACVLAGLAVGAIMALAVGVVRSGGRARPRYE
ncbi:MAG: hypothetical protein MRY74_07545 [Neomegalonema sp.]|nr:hypothetical protein [Neomegalonema sp.]